MTRRSRISRARPSCRNHLLRVIGALTQAARNGCIFLSPSICRQEGIARRCTSAVAMSEDAVTPVTRRRIVRASLPLALVLTAAACANVPMADPQQDAEGKRFERPAPDSGALYIYRSDLMGFARPIDISIAGGVSAGLAANTYLR